LTPAKPDVLDSAPTRAPVLGAFIIVTAACFVLTARKAPPEV
jgi:hypothetical protein